MRHFIRIVESAEGGVGKWWINVRTGEVIDVERAHGDITEKDPTRFGIPASVVAQLKAQYPDDEEPSWWEYVRYEAQKLGWVRVGLGHFDIGDEGVLPYVYAATLGDAHKAFLWMMKRGYITTGVDIEINDPDNPAEGYGDFYKLRDERALKTFERTGRVR